MIEALKQYIEDGRYAEARSIANQLFERGEQSEIFWILNATLYQIEGIQEAEYACISRGLQINSRSYELYFMLGNYYRKKNINQAYLCYEQAEYYCMNPEDLDVIHAEKECLLKSGTCQVHPVSIVILSYNIKDILEGCIQSIRDTCPRKAYELVVVDNASSDGAAEWLKEQGDIVLQCNTENKGFAGGCNQGMKLANDQNDIMLLNNDTILPPNALFWLRMGLYERETVGAVGPLTNFAGNDQQINNIFHTKEEYLHLAEQICIPMPNVYENKVWLVGFAMLVKRCAVEQVGCLDLRYTWGNYEDNDYGMALTEAGYEVLLCYNSFIYHYGSVNMSKNREKYLAYMQANRQKLAEKWGFDSVSYSHADLELLGQIQENPREKICVLEIGCGWGATLARIKHLYPNAEVYGIETVPEAAAFGKYLGNIIIGDVETMELPYTEGMFDYLLISEVQERFPEMDKVLCSVRRFLKESAKIITT